MNVYYLVSGLKQRALPNYLTNSSQFLQQESTDPCAMFRSDVCRRIYIRHCTSIVKLNWLGKRYVLSFRFNLVFSPVHRKLVCTNVEAQA